MHFAQQPRLVLASSSIYRQELLGRLKLPFDAIAPDIDEKPRPDAAPAETAMRLAISKATAVASGLSDAIVIGSDQVATLNNEQIGKPGNHANALRQLQKMQGREVIFHTALCVLDTRLDASRRIQQQNVQTLVRFRNLPETELDAYLKIEQPYDCAGSAKNEALGIALIESIQSDDPTALTGLPLIALTSMLRTAGVRFFSGVA